MNIFKQSEHVYVPSHRLMEKAPCSCSEDSVPSSRTMAPDSMVGALLSTSLMVVVISLSSSDTDLIVQRDFWLRILFNNLLKRILEGICWVFLPKGTKKIERKKKSLHLGNYSVFIPRYCYNYLKQKHNFIFNI